MTTLYNHYINDNSNSLNARFEKTDGNSFFLKFDSPYKTGIPENDLVYAEFYPGSGNKWLYGNGNSRNGNKILSHNINAGNSPGYYLKPDSSDIVKKNTLFLILHGFGTRFQKLANYHELIDNILSFDDSCTCAFLNLPFHLNRMPAYGENAKRLGYFFNEKLKFFHQAVCDIRALIDIAAKKFNFDRIIVCGFSLGCMLSVISMALESRISKGILLFGGGNWHEIHHNSILRYKAKDNCSENKKISKADCKIAYKRYLEFLPEVGEDIFNNKIDLDGQLNLHYKNIEVKSCFLIDPISFAHKIDPSKVIMINTRFDHYFTIKSTNMLWEALGRPELYWMNKMHNSSILSSRKILSLIKQHIFST